MSDPDADDRDYKWLVARERGEDIGHVPAGERAPYDQLGALIGRGVAPSAGFRKRVLDAIDAAEAAEQAASSESEARPKLAPPPARPAEPELAPVVPLPSRPGQREQQQQQQKPVSRRWLVIGGAMAAAAAAAVIFVKRPGEPAGPELAIASEVRHGATQVRAERASGEATLGDTLTVRAEASGPAEVRVYGGSDERLIASCGDRGGRHGCQIEHDGERRRFSLEVPLDVPGRVRVVIFAGANVPPSEGSLDPDLEAAERAHVEHKVEDRDWMVR
jgi:hypothetical protein